jgi:hypothetical protein
MSGIAGDDSPERCCPVIYSGIFDDMSRKIDKQNILRVAEKRVSPGKAKPCCLIAEGLPAATFRGRRQSDPIGGGAIMA